MIVRLFAFLTGRPLVWLQDHDGALTLVPAKRSPFGLIAERWWPFGIRQVGLLPDGTIANGCYVRHWKFDKEDSQ